LSLAGHFLAADWAVLIGYLLLTTFLGARLAGRQATLRDFFLGGRKLPWYAVSGSIIATEISAVTFVSVPAIVFAERGDLTYLQLALGAILARIIIGIWFVPAFYEREIYSPYDYMGARLGPSVRTVTTGLFMLGAVLGQSVRVLLTALILQLMTGLPLGASIWTIGAVAVLWTLLGGITTVIWTDVIQFGVFVLGLVTALFYVVRELPGGAGEMLSVAAEAGKLRFWNFSLDPNVAFTIWAALIANTILCLNAYGTDQLIAQRMFCCRGPREARAAIIVSSVGQIVTVVALAVGLGLYAFYQHRPLTGDAAARVAERVDRIFPLFILQEIPPGLRGLIIAGVFAAAISSLDSVLAALSQTVVSTFYRPWREARSGRRTTIPLRAPNNTAWGTDLGSVSRRAGGPSPRVLIQALREEVGEGRRTPHSVPSSSTVPDTETGAAGHAGAFGQPDERHYVRAARILVVLWAVLLCAMAQVTVLALERYGDILNLALAMATYTGGAMLAAFFLAFLRLNVDARGILVSAPLSVITVLAVSWHQLWAVYTTAILAALTLTGWIIGVFLRPGGRHPDPQRDGPATALAATVGALAVFISGYQDLLTGRALAVAWPWNVPIGFTVAFGLGYLLARPRASPPELPASAAETGPS
jgi:SSS family transporter